MSTIETRTHTEGEESPPRNPFYRVEHVRRNLDTKTDLDNLPSLKPDQARNPSRIVKEPQEEQQQDQWVSIPDHPDIGTPHPLTGLNIIGVSILENPSKKGLGRKRVYTKGWNNDEMGKSVWGTSGPETMFEKKFIKANAVISPKAPEPKP